MKLLLLGLGLAAAADVVAGPIFLLAARAEHSESVRAIVALAPAINTVLIALIAVRTRRVAKASESADRRARRAIQVVANGTTAPEDPRPGGRRMYDPPAEGERRKGPPDA